MNDDLNKRPSIAYLEALLGLLENYNVHSYTEGTLFITMGDAPEEAPDTPDDEVLQDESGPEEEQAPTPQEIVKELLKVTPGQAPSNPYENPLTFGSDRIPHFPEPGDTLKKPSED